MWNQSKWVRVPGRKSRKRVMRPESEWVTHEYSELAIVPVELWEEVQARFTRVYATARGRPAGTGRHVHLISGLMRCGVCGGSMTIVGRRMKAGVSYATFGCTAHSSRGVSICANSLTLSEKKASRMLVNALKEKLAGPELIERFVSSFKKRAAVLRSENTSPLEEADRRVCDCERRIANLTESLAKVGWSDALAAKLREEEALLGRLKSERAAAGREGAPRVVPHPTAIAAYMKNLFALLETDTVRGREILSRFVAPIVMTPEAEGPVRRYRATGAFNLSFFLAGAALSESRSGKSGCAGRI